MVIHKQRINTCQNTSLLLHALDTNVLQSEINYSPETNNGVKATNEQKVPFFVVLIMPQQFFWMLSNFHLCCTKTSRSFGCQLQKAPLEPENPVKAYKSAKKSAAEVFDDLPLSNFFLLVPVKNCTMWI